MKLDLSDNNLKYVVSFDGGGKVSSVALSDGNYCYVGNNDLANINVDSFVEKEELVCNNLSCQCSGVSERIDKYSEEIEKLINSAKNQQLADNYDNIPYSNGDFSRITTQVKLSSEYDHLKYLIQMTTVSHNGINELYVQGQNYCYAEYNYYYNGYDKNNIVENGILKCHESYCKCTGGTNIHYEYWEYAQSKAYSVEERNKPEVTYSDYKELGLTTNNKFIRTRISDAGNILNHEVCVLYNNRTLCFDEFVLEDNETTEQSIARMTKKVNEELNTNDFTCVKNNYDVECTSPDATAIWLSKSGTSLVRDRDSYVAQVVSRDGTAYINARH